MQSFEFSIWYIEHQSSSYICIVKLLVQWQNDERHFVKGSNLSTVSRNGNFDRVDFLITIAFEIQQHWHAISADVLLWLNGRSKFCTTAGCRVYLRDMSQACFLHVASRYDTYSFWEHAMHMPLSWFTRATNVFYDLNPSISKIKWS